MNKFRDTADRKKKQKKINDLSNKKVRETPEGKETQKEIECVRYVYVRTTKNRYQY